MLSSIRKPPPQVTGISPKEGPPGTRVTIRGENLGVDSRDLMSTLLFFFVTSSYMSNHYLFRILLSSVVHQANVGYYFHRFTDMWD